jgi:hypothetical protein
MAMTANFATPAAAFCWLLSTPTVATAAAATAATAASVSATATAAPLQMFTVILCVVVVVAVAIVIVDVVPVAGNKDYDVMPGQCHSLHCNLLPSLLSRCFFRHHCRWCLQCPVAAAFTINGTSVSLLPLTAADLELPCKDNLLQRLKGLS